MCIYFIYIYILYIYTILFFNTYHCCYYAICIYIYIYIYICIYNRFILIIYIYIIYSVRTDNDDMTYYIYSLTLYGIIIQTP